VFEAQAAIDFRSPFHVGIGDQTLTIHDRWVRLHSALVANRGKVLESLAQNGSRTVTLQLVPGRFRGAESKIGEFPPHGAAGPQAGREADALRPHAGQWVAVKGTEVLASASALSELLEKVRRNRLKPDAVQRVPTRGDVEVGGLR
jgi:hypothetical protein